jgi:hypothetical protein
MTNVLPAITKLPRQIKIRSTNGIDENNEVVLYDDKYDRYKEYYTSYYKKNRNWILEKKKTYNQQPHVKQHNAERHHKWYLEHK